MKNFTLLVTAIFLLDYASFAQGNLNSTDAKGFKQGKWVGKYESGKTRYEGNFKDNQPYGTFIYFYETGEKSAELTFSDNGKKNKARFYHINGRLMGRGNYIDQKKDSTWLYYDDREILSHEENYMHGKREGISRVFYLDGSVAEEKNYRNNVENGPCKQWYPEGKLKYEANYLDGNPEGKVTHYHYNGQIKSTGLYQYAVKNGEWISYNEDGSVFMSETYKKGELATLKKENGLFTTQYPSGNTKEEFTYSNGLKNGAFKEFFDKAAEPDSTSSGFWEPEKMYNENTDFMEQTFTKPQKIKTTGNYKNDKLDGEVNHFDINGKLEKTDFYRDGELIPGQSKKGKK